MGPVDPEHERFADLLIPVDRQLFAFCRSLAGSVEAGKELHSMARCRAWEKFSTFRGESFRLWIFKIARNLFYRETHRVANRREYALEDSLGIESAKSEEQIVARLDCEILEKSMQRLKPKERETFSLFWIEGLLLREIREVQGGTMSGVKSRLSRATRKLRRIIAPTEIVMVGQQV